MQNHPLMYPLPDMLDRLAAAEEGRAESFCGGQSQLPEIRHVMEACTEVNIARRK